MCLCACVRASERGSWQSELALAWDPQAQRMTLNVSSQSAEGTNWMDAGRLSHWPDAQGQLQGAEEQAHLNSARSPVAGKSDCRQRV